MKMKSLQNTLAALIVLISTSTFAATISVTSAITTNTNWTNNNLYILYGDIVIKSGATLTIEPGTIIKGDKTTGGRVVVAMGGKINAQGTASQPIVFTSNQPAGQRQRGDWSGIAICGKAPVNFKDANGNAIQGRLECGQTTDYDFGGTDPADNSGVLSYVRIEYAGFVCGSNSELNSLTMGGVGSGTKLDHVMVSYGQDDGFEWFGGTVNASHLISFASRDDDFDTDNGFSGKVQFGLVVRIDTIADQGDISNAFESDNDANSTYNNPATKAVFSNITVVGPAQTTTSTIDAKYGWGARIRRNTSLSIFNSLFLGYKRGLRIEGVGSQNKALTDSLEFKYNIIEGSKEQAWESSFDSSYLANATTYNTVYGGNANATLKLVNPFNRTNPDFRLDATSPALTGANFTNTKLAGLPTVNYKGAFGGTDDWTAGWASFNPQTNPYSAPTAIDEVVNLSNTVLVPNPNQGKAALLVDLKENAMLAVDLYDIAGRRVASIANGEFNSGIQSLNIDLSAVNNGVYFVSVIIENAGTTTLKMVVNK